MQANVLEEELVMVVPVEATPPPVKNAIIVARLGTYHELAPGGGSEGQGPGSNRGNRTGRENQGDDFPGVDDTGIRNPSRPGEPRERILPNGSEVKWCGLCGKWGDHYRAGHPIAIESEEAEGAGEGNVAFDNLDVNGDDPPPSTGAFARLYAAGLI